MKNKFILTLGLITLFNLGGCMERYSVESQSFKKYTIIGINRPKHFRVALQDESGRVFQKVSVSKHCNRWREVQLGSVVTLNTVIMTNKDGTDRWIDIEARSICPGN